MGIMEKKKIIMLFNCPFLDSFIQKYCLNEIIKLNYELIVVDLSNVLERNYKNATKGTFGRNADFQILDLKNYSEVELFIKENAKTALFLPMFDFIFSARKIFYYFTKYNVEYGYVNNLLSPLLTPESATNKILLKKYKLNPNYIRSALFHRVWRYVLPYKRADFMCFSGTKGEEFLLKEGACKKNIRRIYLYAFDYENFLRQEGYQSNREYCVFIDQFIPFHPDNVVHNNIHIDPAIYYDQVEKCLEAIKKKYDVAIIVAAHPQANYANIPYFKKYKIEYGKTAALVKNSKLVCAHFSTSIIMGVMGRKKIILLNVESLHEIKNWQNEFVRLQSLFNCPVYCNENEILVSSNDCEFSEEIYEKCMSANFARTEVNNKLLWERVFDEIFIGE